MVDFIYALTHRNNHRRFGLIFAAANTLHMNEEFARESQFGKRVVHGCFSSALISAIIGMKLPRPGALYVS